MACAAFTKPIAKGDGKPSMAFAQPVAFPDGIGVARVADDADVATLIKALKAAGIAADPLPESVAS